MRTVNEPYINIVHQSKRQSNLQNSLDSEEQNVNVQNNNFLCESRRQDEQHNNGLYSYEIYHIQKDY